MIPGRLAIGFLTISLLAPSADVRALEEAASVAPASKSRTVAVRLLAVDSQGNEAPVADAEVMLEAWSQPPGPMRDRQLDAAWTARTNAAGAVGFDIAAWPKNSELIPTLVRDGLTYKGRAITHSNASKPIDIRLYEVTSVRDALSGSIHVSLSLRDGFLIVDSSISLSNSGGKLVDLGADGQGFRLPILFPAVFGGPVDLGFVAEDTGKGHMSLRATPSEGFFEIDQGAVWFHGVVAPGQGPTLQARYALPIIQERQDLALHVPIPVGSFILSTEWNKQVAPWIVPEHEFRVVERRQGESVQRFIRVGEEWKAGEAVVIRIDHLPVGHRLYRDVALHGSLGLCAIFFMFFMVARRRHV